MTNKKYEIKKTGRLWHFNFENTIINDTIVHYNTKKICDTFLKDVFKMFPIPHSAYLRGSSILDNVIDDNVFDLDITLVYDVPVKNKNSFYIDKNGNIDLLPKENILADKLTNICGKYLLPDICLYTKDIFLNKPVTRFLSKQIYGGKNLAKNVINFNELSVYTFEDCLEAKQHNTKTITNLKKYLHNNKIQSKIVKKAMIDNVIKFFFRFHSHSIFLKNRVYTRDIYYCYEYLINEYPVLADDIHLFFECLLNSHTYNNNEILYVLDKIDYVFNFIVNKFLYENE